MVRHTLDAFRPPHRGVPLLVLLALVAVGVLTFGGHVLHGGFHGDDWSHSAGARYPAKDGPLGATRHLLEVGRGQRPLLSLYIPAVHGLFGTDARLHLGWALAVAVAGSVLLFAVLRALEAPA